MSSLLLQQNLLEGRAKMEKGVEPFKTRMLSTQRRKFCRKLKLMLKAKWMWSSACLELNLPFNSGMYKHVQLYLFKSVIKCTPASEELELHGMPASWGLTSLTVPPWVVIWMCQLNSKIYRNCTHRPFDWTGGSPCLNWLPHCCHWKGHTPTSRKSIVCLCLS